jgi:hypothetical protein
MRETSPFEEAVGCPAVLRIVEEDKTTTQVLKKGLKKTCKKARATGRGKMQFAIPIIGIFRGKKSTAKKATAETEPEGSSSSKPSAKKEIKKDPSPLQTEMREPPPFEEAGHLSTVMSKMQKKEAPLFEDTVKGAKKTCKKTRTTGSGKKQLAIPIVIFRGEKSTAKQVTADTQPEASSSSKTTAKKQMKKEPLPLKALSPSTLSKFEGTSSLKTTVKKEIKKKLPSAVVLLPSTVPKRGSLFLRTCARGKPKKIVDSQIGDCISGQVKKQRTVNDDCDMR